MITSISFERYTVRKRISICEKTIVETTLYESPQDAALMYTVKKGECLNDKWKVSVKPTRLKLKRQPHRRPDPKQMELDLWGLDHELI